LYPAENHIRRGYENSNSGQISYPLRIWFYARYKKGVCGLEMELSGFCVSSRIIFGTDTKTVPKISLKRHLVCNWAIQSDSLLLWSSVMLL